jgi:hypothetical protein
VISLFSHNKISFDDLSRKKKKPVACIKINPSHECRNYKNRGKNNISVYILKFQHKFLFPGSPPSKIKKQKG